ncbi:subtilisin-chymotrypsin inhibitor CI-1C [Lolium perenne]|uniref:subtilisin-chymotrypsin inhibitor CI-1C n=1 Tax=Lolium perenne TaxID=4522 RepID=UPI0021F5162D|nr:subtilisin inhibitor 1-like [Lolium perenne]
MLKLRVFKDAYSCRFPSPPRPQLRPINRISILLENQKQDQQTKSQVSPPHTYIQVLDFAKMGDAKSSWPELLGAPSDAAKEKILSDRPDVSVIVLPVGSIVTTEFNPKRVRVFVDSYSVVAEVPKIG